MRRLIVLLAALGGLLVAAPPANSSGAAQTHPLVRPKGGGRQTTFHVYLTSRAALGINGVFARSYIVAAHRRLRAGCTASAGGTLSSGVAGQVLRADLRPARGSAWCPGRFSGAVTLSSGPYCPRAPLRGAAIPCPEFATQILPAGHFSFRVS